MKKLGASHHSLLPIIKTADVPVLASRLHGLRIAMVRGTNSWTLHGSKTNYFEKNYRILRAAFRG